MTGTDLALALGVLALVGLLFLTDLTLVDRPVQDEAKIGILVASATAATLGWLLFTVTGSPDRGHRPPAGGTETGSGAAPAGERGSD